MKLNIILAAFAINLIRWLFLVNICLYVYLYL